MRTVLLGKLKESSVSVLPVVGIVFLLKIVGLADFSAEEIITFLVSAAFLIFGISLFNLGADLAMTPMGENIGSGLTKTRKFSLLILLPHQL